MNNTTQEGFNIDVFALLGALWKNIILIILVAALSGAIAFGYTLFKVPPTYSATTTLYVNKSTFSLGDNFTFSTSLSTTTLVDIYMLIIQSRTTLEEVIEEAHLDMPSNQLKKMINATGLTDGAFNITVTSSDPAQAELIANTVAKILPDRIADIIDGSSVRVIDYAIIPSTRSSPDYIKSTLTGVLAGAVVCAVVVMGFSFLRSNSDTSIQSGDELRSLFPDIPVLASIPDMRTASKKSAYSSYYGTKESKGGK